MNIYLDNGVNIDASWVNHIAVSSDGVNWTPINKSFLSVNQRWLNLSSDPNFRHPWVNKGSHGLITLRYGTDSEVALVFDPNDVINQATWQGNTTAELQVAVADITGWLA